MGRVSNVGRGPPLGSIAPGLEIAGSTFRLSLDSPFCYRRSMRSFLVPCFSHQGKLSSVAHPEILPLRVRHSNVFYEVLGGVRVWRAGRVGLGCGPGGPPCPPGGPLRGGPGGSLGLRCGPQGAPQKGTVTVASNCFGSSLVSLGVSWGVSRGAGDDGPPHALVAAVGASPPSWLSGARPQETSKNS